MVDEMYLQKATQYQGDQYVVADEVGNLFKGIIVFMIFMSWFKKVNPICYSSLT